MTESIEQIKDRVQDLILDHGFAVQRQDIPDCCYREGTQSLLAQHVEIYHGGVKPCAYSYTIGRTLKGRPELLISGLPSDISAEYLANAVALDDVVPFGWGEPRRYVFGEQMAFPVEIDPWSAQMFTAIASFGQITALQLLWPDDAGAFPGDPDYVHDASIQRVFA